MHTVQLALARGAADRFAGPTLGAGVPAKGWTLDGAVALQRQPKAGTGHSISQERLALDGLRRRRVDQKLRVSTFLYPFGTVMNPK